MPVNGSVLVTGAAVAVGVVVVVTVEHVCGLYAEHVEPAAMASLAAQSTSTALVIKIASRFISPFRVCV